MALVHCCTAVPAVDILLEKGDFFPVHNALLKKDCDAKRYI